MQFNVSTRVHEDQQLQSLSIFIHSEEKKIKYNVTNVLCKSTKVAWQGNK